jgi:uncharacterized membrane protein YphA (DoxX/SURF4 family)
MTMSAGSNATRGGADPRWIDAILEWPITWLAARLGLTSAYLVGGVTKLLDFQAAVAEQQHFGLNPGWLWAAMTIVVELGGSALLISGRYTWFAAGALGVLTAIATLRANAFWAMQGHERFVAFNGFFEHIGLIAGLVMAALIAEHAKRDAGDRRTSASEHL